MGRSPSVIQQCAPLALSQGGLPEAAPGHSLGQLSLFNFNISIQLSCHLRYAVSAMQRSNVKCLSPTSTMQEYGPAMTLPTQAQ